MNRNRTRKHGGNRSNKSRKHRSRRNKSRGGRRGTRLGRHGSINLYQNKLGLKGFRTPLITW